MPMYNLIEYSDKYSDTSGSLCQFKRHEIERDKDLTVNDNHIPNNSSLFNYKSRLIPNRNGVKIAVSLKYLSKFWRSLEMLLINCKVELSLSWDPNCDPNPSYQGVKRLFVLAYDNGDSRVTADSHRMYFLPRIKTEK